jgi:hypothetical protein
MVAVTYGVARIATTKAAGRAQAVRPRRTLFTRFMDALVESRLKQVHREIARHAHLLSPTFDERGNPLV